MPGAATWAFKARVCRPGILRCVDVPQKVATVLDDWQYPPVVATVGERERATTLMRRGDGGFRPFLHDGLRRAAGGDAGDMVHVELIGERAQKLRPTDDG